MKYLLAVMFSLVAVTAYAGFYDYRMARIQTPDEFETSAAFDAMYPGSITIFEKGHRLEWTAENIQDYLTDGSNLTAIMQDDIVYLPDGVCGGMVVPRGTNKVTYDGGDYLVASTDEIHSFYYLPECAGYGTFPREGIYLDISPQTVCEADAFEYIIRDINTGRVVYRENSENYITAVYASADKCYFLENSGDLVQLDSTFERFVVAEAGEIIMSAETTPIGITAMTPNAHVDITFGSGGVIYTNFLTIPNKGICVPTRNGTTLFCTEDYYSNIANAALDAEYISVLDESLLLYTGGRLTSYSMDGDWVKSFVTLYDLPSGCTVDEKLYFFDLVGDLRSANLVTHDEQAEDVFPSECYFAQYRDGSFYSWDGSFIHKFSDLIVQNGDKLLYKRVQDNKIFYYMIYE